MPREQAGTKDSCKRGLAEHQTQSLEKSVGSRLQAVTDLQRIYNQILKVSILFMIILVWPITFVHLK